MAVGLRHVDWVECVSSHDQKTLLFLVTPLITAVQVDSIAVIALVLSMVSSITTQFIAGFVLGRVTVHTIPAKFGSALVVTTVTVDEVAVTTLIVALVVGSATRDLTDGRTPTITRPQQLHLASRCTAITIIHIEVIALLIPCHHSITTEPVTRVTMVGKRVPGVA